MDWHRFGNFWASFWRFWEMEDSEHVNDIEYGIKDIEANCSLFL